MSYNDRITLMIVSESYEDMSSINRIIDAIHLCGNGGHSFSIVADKSTTSDAKDIVRLGGYDGDGADAVYQQTFENSKDVYAVTVIGTRCGLESIKEVIDNMLKLKREINTNFIVTGEYSEDGPFGSFGWDDENKPITVAMSDEYNYSTDFSKLIFMRRSSR